MYIDATLPVDDEDDDEFEGLPAEEDELSDDDDDDEEDDEGKHCSLHELCFSTRSNNSKMNSQMKKNSTRKRAMRMLKKVIYEAY